MDWREFTGLSTAAMNMAKGSVGKLLELATKSQGGQEGVVSELGGGFVRVVEPDFRRGWIVALGWVVASLVE